ncbi:glycoside hydrolase [Thozetella sp. PMI_491]|nr:glycoside hydrolase [Thozetella sp. PMI_491]
MAYTKEYPRPDFSRPGQTWLALDGAWDFLFDDTDQGLREGWHRRPLPEQVTAPQGSTSKRQIQVPFAFQTPASGIGERGDHEVLWYERVVQDIRTAPNPEHRLLLRFGAVDYEASVWADGQLVATHIGGHVPFDVDVSDGFYGPTGEKKNEVRLTIRVRDSPSDLTQPRGKQYWKAESESIFYTPTSGIWQPVWLESVPAMRVGEGSHGTVLRTDDIKGGIMHAKVAVLGRPAGSACSVEIAVRLGNIEVSTSKADLKKDKEYATVDVDMRLAQEQQERYKSGGEIASWRDGIALWSPEHPTLYDVVLRLFDSGQNLVDEVATTVGMRSISWENKDGTLRLNDEPYFQALVLDQGYWPETGLTPPSQESLKVDIDLAKKMGFNGCRKHQKQEDPLFLYWADKLGYLVWGEIANAYKFDEVYMERFDAEWRASVLRDINHPCVVAWTPVNESWGYTALKQSSAQRHHIRSLYYLTKTLDPTRPINDNCGWETVLTDLFTFHDYADGPELAKTCSTLEGILGPHGGRDMYVGEAHERFVTGQPVLCTEFGGVNIAPAKDTAAGEKDWGYTTAADSQDLLRRIEGLVMAIVDGGHCCGFVYTQLTDVEQEVNGLYTFDRKEKLDVAGVRAIMESAIKKYYAGIASK